MMFAPDSTDPKSHTTTKEYQASGSSKGTDSCQLAVTSPLLFVVVQTVAKPSVNQPYLAPRKKAGSERQSETLEEKSSDVETSYAEQVRDFRVPRLSLRLFIVWLVTSCPVFDMGLHL